MSQDMEHGNKTSLTEAEETLRLVARMPSPEGLEERVKARMENAPRSGRLLAWPGADRRWSQLPLVRGAAAAMIVCVVGGGAWGMYAHVQSQMNAAQAMPAPIRQSSPGGFSNAGAMRSPQSQVVLRQEKPKDASPKSAASKTGKHGSESVKANHRSETEGKTTQPMSRR